MVNRGEGSGSGKQTPAEARRRRLAASLRSNLRRRKDQGRSRAGETAGLDGEAAGLDNERDSGQDTGDEPDGGQT